MKIEHKVFSGLSCETIEQKIDDFLATGQPFKDVPLILAVGGHSCRFNYRGITIREWCRKGKYRYDAAVELL